MLPAGLPGWNGSGRPADGAVIRRCWRLQRHPSSANAAMAGQLVGQSLHATDAPRTQRDARALHRKKPGDRLASPLLAPVMTTTIPSMLLLMILTPACHEPLRDRSSAPASRGTEPPAP